MATLRVATLNLRNLADRWDERLPLLLADMAALQPDLIEPASDARLAFDRRAVGDPTLYPSAPFGLVATVWIGRDA